MYCKLTPFGKRIVKKAVEGLESRVLLSSWYVAASGGLDANPGTLAQPFATIQDAANVAMPGDSVFIESGTYHETVKPVNSGTAGAPITYEPYNGATVTIDGADPITGWTLSSDSTYEAPQSWDLGDGNNQVFANGQMLTEARWPNTSLDPMNITTATITSTNAAPATQDTPTSATIYNAALSQQAGYWVGATIHVSPGQQWIWETGTVTASAPGSITYSYTQLTPSEVPQAGNPFYLSGLFSQLDAPGEFYHNSASDILYAWMPDGSAPTNVESKQRQYAFDLSGLGYIDIQGLTIHAASIDTDSVSNHIEISDSTFTFVSQQMDNAYPWGAKYVAGTTGLLINGTNITLSDLTITDSSGNGVYLGGSNNTVQDCTISQIDYAAGDEAAINIRGTGNVASHNLIFDTGRSGITFYFSPQTQIFNNVIHDIGLRGSDSGGVYAWKTDGMGSEVSQNIIYNAYQGGYGNSGILLDNNDLNMVIDHNIVYNADAALKMNGVSTDDFVYDNTLLSGINPNPPTVALLNPPSALIEGASPSMPGSKIINNIMIGSVMYSTGVTHTNNLTSAVSAMFVDQADDNFQLLSGSAAIDAGALIPPYTNGFAGAAPDIGADEFGGQPVQAGPSQSPQIVATPASAQSATQNTPATIQLGSFSASGATGPFSVTVNWGDGSANSVFSVNNAGSIPAMAHTFSGAGKFDPAVTVSDAAAHTSNTVSFVVTVAVQVIVVTPTQLAIAQQPTGAIVGAAISPALTVDIQDANGNTISPSDPQFANVTLSIASGPAGAALGGTTTVTQQAGVATFANLSFSLPGAYTLTATDGSLTAATTASFTIMAPPPQQLAFAQQPTGGAAESTIVPAITIDIEDAGGNIVAPADAQFSNVVLSVAGGPAGATLGGATTVAEQAGVATFSDISISLPGTYALTASDGSLKTAVSHSFTIAPPAKATVNVTVSSSNPATVQYQLVTLVATVAPVTQTGAVPTGAVNFYDGQTLLYTGAVSSAGTVQFTTSTLQPGAHSITASYAGDSAFASGVSPALSQTINAIAPDAPLLSPSLANAKIPASVVEGTPIKSVLPVVIANHGGGLYANAVSITVFASQNQTFDPTAVQILSLTHAVKLKPGAGKIISVKPGSLPTTLANGSYYFIVQVVDQSGSVTQTTAAAAMQVAAPFVSLAASVGGVTPGIIPPGKHGAVAVTITNTGNVIAAGSATINVGLSADGSAVAASLVSLVKNVKIKPGSALTLHLRFTRSASQAAGTYFPTVSVSLNGQDASMIGTVPFMLT
ncbi:MAG TPA: Ig-like domain repeat protein [Tepidisphaeraceae bacterium]|jgi:parallel beta-helix repeat protein|nr:Ig-like domain repeat protein [Tepidisphaeraceae bacterium]